MRAIVRAGMTLPTSIVWAGSAALAAQLPQAMGIGREPWKSIVPSPVHRPTLFDNVRPDSRLAQEEIFGPVLAAMPFETYDEALRIANGVSLGLTASVYTRDLGTAHRFARDVDAGYVWVNDTQTHLPGAAYGGFKDSGVGREEGFEELVSYAQVKNVNVKF